MRSGFANKFWTNSQDRSLAMASSQMNRAYLRPPLPLYRVAAVLTLPLVVWLSFHVMVAAWGRSRGFTGLTI